ncbi:MAG: hypothetical protein IPG84_15420, partial [Betaproteobacteria bacterium]|nr:hypothetical protein [Betaproteobacteria bacterium]
GDFANGAQVVIDQLIASGEVKWADPRARDAAASRLFSRLRPEHSSARPERYLQLCAQHNMQVVVPSTPAQIFHPLRRQMIRPVPPAAGRDEPEEPASATRRRCRRSTSSRTAATRR